MSSKIISSECFSFHFSDETLKAREDMYAKELKHYKFYLSFENSLCLDYITEKFFLAFHAGVVPIVYGGKSKEDYINVSLYI